MRIRKQTQADHIRDMKIERQNREESLEALEALGESGWTRDNMETIQEHQKWLKTNVPVINGFYKPAMVAE